MRNSESNAREDGLASSAVVGGDGRRVSEITADTGGGAPLGDTPNTDPGRRTTGSTPALSSGKKNVTEKRVKEAMEKLTQLVGIAELTAALEEAEARLAHITGLIAELEQPSPSGPGTWLKVSWSNASHQSRPPAPPQTHTHTHTNAYGARGLKIFCFAADAAVPLRRTGLRP